MAPRAYWKGYLKLFLVSCPIALFPATPEREKISFHQINKNTSHRIKYRKVDAESGDEVEAGDIIKDRALNSPRPCPTRAQSLAAPLPAKRSSLKFVLLRNQQKQPRPEPGLNLCSRGESLALALLAALSGLLLAALSGLLALLTGLLLAAAALLTAALLAALLLLTRFLLTRALATLLATLIGIVHDRSCVRLAPTSPNRSQRGKFLPCCRLASRSRSCGQAPTNSLAY